MPSKNWELREKKTYGYRERGEIERQEFQEKLKVLKREKIVYVDEAGIDNREDYPYGYCEIGKRFFDLKSGRRTERVSWIAALNQGRIFAPLTFKGSCNTHLVETWVSECLVPQLIPGQIVVMDNASFHQSASIAELIEGAGCELWYLPKYSPDLNKIERWWFV